MISSLNNDDQSCAQKLKKLKILGGIVGGDDGIDCSELKYFNDKFFEGNVSQDHKRFGRNIFFIVNK